jgi:DNA-binding SARP family transcriptional activator
VTQSEESIATEAASENRLRVRLLGPPRADLDGAPVEVDTRKATALLAYLAVTARPHSRGSLTALLWPDYDDDRARAALRRTLSALKKSLGGGWLVGRREAVELSRAGMWLDVDAFRDLVRAAESHGHDAADPCPTCFEWLTRAEEVYRGDFLSGFAMRDGAGFEEWQLFEADGLRRELGRALERLVAAETGAGFLERALHHARRWLALDPLHEPAHRELMRLYALAGDRSAALRQYRQCVAILDQELGVPPLEEITELYETIRSGELPEGTAPAAAVAVSQKESVELDVAQLPLVGRTAELDALVNAYQEVGPDGRLVIVEGEAGAGKTRVCDELARRAEAMGARTLEARCHEGESGFAYAPLVTCVRGAFASRPEANWLDGVEDHWLSECARLLPEIGAVRGGLESPTNGPGAQQRLFEGLCRVLSAGCDGPKPGLVVIDDVHWADDATVDVLAYLVRRLAGRPLCIAISWRNEEVAQGHPLRALAANAHRGGSSTVVGLSRLGRLDVEALVEAALGRREENADGLSQRVYQETEGSPLFVVEYLAALKAGEGAAENNWSPSGGVRALLLSRISGVGQIAGQVLSAASVIGRSFDLEVVRLVSGRGEEETVSAVEELTRRGLVRDLEDGGHAGSAFDFTHEKIRAVVYEQTSLARRRLLHGRAAQALLSRAGRDLGPVAAAVARHFQRAGEDAEAAEYFLRAGEHAAAVYANPDALSHLEKAVALGHPDSAHLWEMIGDLHTLTGSYGAAGGSYEKAAASCPSEELPRIEHKLGDVQLRRGNWDAAESHFEAALDAVGSTDPALAARIYSDKSLAVHRRGRVQQAQELAERALHLSREAGDRRAMAQAENILGILARARHNPEASVHHLQRSLAAAAELGDDGARVAATNNLALALAQGGDLDGAQSRLEDALATCHARGDRHREAALHNNLADLLRAAGRREEALVHLKESARLFSEVGEKGVLEPEIWKLVEW